MNWINKAKNVIKNWSIKRFFVNIYYLGKYNLEQVQFDQAYTIKDEVLEECVLELEDYRRRLVQLQMLDSQETIRMLADQPKSFTRFGDGEIHIMQGQNQPFQKYDPELARKMREILAEKRDDVYVGLNHAYWESPLNFAERNRKFYRVNSTRYRRFFTEHCDLSGVYLDAACFGAYYRFDDSFDYEGHYSKIKALFAGKKIAILSGEGVFEKLEHNVFSEAQSQIIVHGPRVNAFSEYASILEKIEKEVPKDHLICLILGQTATVLVPDLTDMGYMAWDVGHIAKDYDAYMKKTEKTQKNIDAFWAPD